MLRRLNSLLAAALLVLLSAGIARAQAFYDAPLVELNGHVQCATCCTSAAALTLNGVVIGGGLQAVSTIAVNATGTPMYLRQVSGGAPAMTQIAIGELASFSSGDLAGILSDEVGASGGFVRGAAGANAHIAAWQADGSLGDGGVAGGSPIIPRIPLHFMAVQVTAGTPVWCGLDGLCSTTTNGVDVQSRVSGTGTFTAIELDATAPTTQAITSVLCVGTCNAAPTCTSKAQNLLSSSAWTRGTSSGNTSFTDGQCLVFQHTVGSGTSAKVNLRGSMSESAGS